MKPSSSLSRTFPNFLCSDPTTINLHVVNPSYSLFTFSDGTALLDLSKDAYRRRLTQFLFSSAGAKFRLLFRFDEEPSCTDPAPDMVVRVAFVLYWTSSRNLTHFLKSRIVCLAFCQQFFRGRLYLLHDHAAVFLRHREGGISRLRIILCSYA